jgi:hypothetical protein
MNDSLVYRINDFSILEERKSITIQQFMGVKDLLSLDNTHFFQETSIRNVVWEGGIYSHRLNGLYSTQLFIPDETTQKENLRAKLFVLKLKAHFDWTNIFGIHVILKTVKTNKILISQIFRLSDFSLNFEFELINNELYSEKVNFFIPEISDEIVMAQVTVINFADIVDSGISIGFIHTFPTEFVPLIDEKPLPDYITSKVNFDENHYINVELKTTELKTVERSLLDYFGLSLGNITVNYVIQYGNETKGFYSLKVKNELDQFLPVNLGLNLKHFENEVVNIIVTAEIYVETKLIRRITMLTSDLSELNPLIQSQLVQPETMFPVNITNETIVNNTIIQTKEVEKIIPIYQPIFIEFINKEFKIEPKNIFFDYVDFHAHMEIEGTDKDSAQTLFSDITSDEKIYFDLSKLVPVSKETKYRIISVQTKKIIGEGKILV